MEVSTEQTNGVLVAEAWKRVDGTNARAFERALRESISHGESAVVIDCKNLTYMSSAGLRVILLTAKTLSKQQAKFAICNLAPPIREVFEISGFDKIIAIFAARDEAVASLGG